MLKDDPINRVDATLSRIGEEAANARPFGGKAVRFFIVFAMLHVLTV
ncbi:hypothetical protein [Stieleria magnilauensis]|uniref:Uncharacterized protein n=1 Tax=Stieleria magnilauensis TaxID=2527963 RepID=A0ABX5XKL7_9BACT|nr:hypothetical protein TBK1r_14640 [Planctomycetes bacterium TBK1r]